MIRIIAAVAIALVATASADAAPRNKSQNEARAWQSTVVAAHSWAPGFVRPVGPSWAGPNECFTDDGYGRFCAVQRRPCGPLIRPHPAPRPARGFARPPSPLRGEG